MRGMSVLIAIALFCFFAATAFADEMVSIKTGYQVLSPSGFFSGETDGVATRIDMEDDIDFDDSEDLTAEIAVQLGSSRLSFNYLPISFTGVGNGEFIFNGQSFSGDVKGEVAADIYDIGYTYYLLNFDDLPTRFQLGLELAVKVIDGEASLAGSTDILPTEVTTESVEGTAPIPTLGLRTRIALADFLGLVGRLGYMEVDDNSFTDAEVQLEVSPVPLVGLYGGYRYFDLEVNESDLVLDVEFSGPFVGALVRF